jgi:hypothetical protein
VSALDLVQVAVNGRIHRYLLIKPVFKVIVDFSSFVIRDTFALLALHDLVLHEQLLIVLSEDPLAYLRS